MIPGKVEPVSSVNFRFPSCIFLNCGFSGSGLLQPQMPSSSNLLSVVPGFICSVLQAADANMRGVLATCGVSGDQEGHVREIHVGRGSRSQENFGL